jgi:MerR family transcriptional regulator/heat shock protein HspR
MTRPTDPHHTPPQAQPDADEFVYTVEIVASLTGMPADEILHFKEQGLLQVPAAPTGEDPMFTDETVRAVRRIQYLRSTCGVNDTGLRLILRLTDELERLSELLHARR